MLRESVCEKEEEKLGAGKGEVGAWETGMEGRKREGRMEAGWGDGRAQNKMCTFARHAPGVPFTPFMSSTCARAVCASLGSAERMTEADRGRGRSAGWWSSGMGRSGGWVGDAILIGEVFGWWGRGGKG